VRFLEEKINKLYFTFLISALGSSLITTVYSTVDTIAIGQHSGPVGSAAIACVNPLWPCMLTLGILFGMGGSVMMNYRRGEGREEEANEFFSVSLILSLIASVAIALVFTFFMEELLSFFGAKGAVLEAAKEYARPFAFGAPFFTLCSTASTFIRNDGEAYLPTVGTAVGGIVNVFGDIFFVFDFGLGLGLYGAGLATVLGQIASFLIIFSYFFRKKCKLRFALPHGTAKKLGKIAGIGAPAAIIEVAFGLTTVVFNNIISANLSDAHHAAYGTASTVLVTFYCMYYALGTSLQPIVSANLGAGLTGRVKKTLRLALISAVVLSGIFLTATQLFPDTLLRLYMDVDETVLAVGPRIMRLYTLALPTAGIAIVACYYLQSVLKQTLSTILSLMRGVVLPIAFCLTLPLVTSYEYVWLAVPLAEAVTAACALVFITVTGRKMNSK